MAIENDLNVDHGQHVNGDSRSHWTFSLRETFISLTALCAIAGWYAERNARIRFEDVAGSIFEAVEEAKVNPPWEVACAGWIDGIFVSWVVNEGALSPVPDLTGKSDREESASK